MLVSSLPLSQCACWYRFFFDCSAYLLLDVFRFFFFLKKQTELQKLKRDFYFVINTKDIIIPSTLSIGIMRV